jgi:hypothetical protein
VGGTQQQLAGSDLRRKRRRHGSPDTHDHRRAGIRPGRYAERLNHYTLLRTIEKACGLPPLGRARAVSPLSTIWKA